MQIRVRDVYSTILNAREHVEPLVFVRAVCRARPNGYQFMKKYRSGHWDGFVSLMHTFSEFPTGLLDDVCNTLAHHGYTIELIDDNGRIEALPVTKDLLNGIELRDYQIKAAEELITAERGVAKMATNSGKTEVMAAIIKALGSHSVVLVHRKELMYQTAERFTERGLVDVGMIGDGIFNPRFTTVAMIQTLDNRDDVGTIFKDNKILFIDECHHLTGKQATDAFYSIPGHYRFGVSGTPLKNQILEDLKLIAATGPVVYELTNDFLIKMGYSARPHVALYTIESMSDELWKEDYQEAYKHQIVNGVQRNEEIADFAKSAKGTILILVNRIEHGIILSKMTGGVFVSGNNSTEERRKVLDAMRTTTGIFIASPIFDEGVDVPGVNVVILAGGGKSQVKLLQRLGRGMRHKHGVNKLEVLDFIDDTNKYLLEHSNARIDTYAAEGFDTTIN